ncbi:hypothetical protein [Sulfurovum sp.]|uniref:hypothetical protein n=1 Tax=Sulfurovum sp. TaxID=1969726 RepID=UPI0035685ECC
MKFKKIELHAFRAYKDKENGTFDFTLPDNKIANFVSIYAPNGFGKTSFYDGVEWGMTKNIRRLIHKSEIAKAERGVVEKIHQQRKKQYVLKNRDANEDTVGFVSLFTTKNDQPIKSTIIEPSRAGATDFLFNDSTTENKYFRDVILSQDGIDAFLTEDNAKDRYKKFINYFGDEKIEKYYSQINQLQKSNDKNTSLLQAKIVEIQKKLQIPVDKEVFQNVNKQIEALKNYGEDFNAINDEFNQSQKLQLDDQIDKRKIEIRSLLEGQNKFKEILLNKMAEIDSYFEKKGKYTNLEKKIKAFQKIQDTAKAYENIKQKITAEKDQQKYLNDLKIIFPNYETIRSEVIANTDELTKYKTNLINISNELQQFISDNALVLEKKKQVSKNLDAVNELIRNAPNLFVKIKDLEDEISLSRKTIQDKQSQVDELQKQENSLQESEKKQISIIQAAKENIFLEIRENEKYKVMIEEIETSLDEQRLLDRKLLDLQSEQNKHQQFNSELKSLLSLGSSLINSNHLDACPLCSQPYEAYENLQEKVLNNSMLNDMEKELLSNKKDIEISIATLRDKINIHQKNLYTALNNDLQTIQLDLKKIKHSMKQSNQNITGFKKSLLKFESEYQLLLIKTDKLTQNDFLLKKKKSKHEYQAEIKILDKRLKELEASITTKRGDVSLVEVKIKTIETNINELTSKDEWKNIEKFKQDLLDGMDTLIEIESKISVCIDNHTHYIDEQTEKKIKLDELLEKAEISTIENLQEQITESNNEIEVLVKDLQPFESYYLVLFEIVPDNKEEAKKAFGTKNLDVDKSLKRSEKTSEMLDILKSYGDNLSLFIEQKKLIVEKDALSKEVKLKNKVAIELNNEKKSVEAKINKDVQAFFHEELINNLYKKIDPHPEYKHVKFECSFDKDGGKLNIFVSEAENEEPISPALYYSTAQLNVLSLSIFLAKALNAKDDQGENVNCIFIDDPIQSMDSINILATIDLLRSLVVNHNKQIILSTHDENFHSLLKKKIPEQEFGSIFIRLETFGKVKKEL